MRVNKKEKGLTGLVYKKPTLNIKHRQIQSKKMEKDMMIMSRKRKLSSFLNSEKADFRTRQNGKDRGIA